MDAVDLGFQIVVKAPTLPESSRPSLLVVLVRRRRGVAAVGHILATPVVATSAELAHGGLLACTSVSTHVCVNPHARFQRRGGQQTQAAPGLNGGPDVAWYGRLSLPP